MDIKVWIYYLVLEFLIGITPGPAVLAVVNQTLKHKIRNGVICILGISISNFFYFSLASAGLWVFLSKFPKFILYTQYIGSIFIIMMGIVLIAKTSHKLPAQKIKKKMASFTTGVSVQLINPKAFYFFILVLPQFIDMKKNYNTQIIILGITSILLEVLILFFYVFITSKGVRYIENDNKFFYYLDRFTGASLIVTGVFFIIQIN